MQTQTLSHLILQHLLKNPDAGDTLEGITCWWVAHEVIEIRIKEVSEAVDVLVQDGMLVEKTIANSEKLYFVNKTKLDKIREVIERVN
ncbi:MAG TPA: hypothetical protein VL633_02815 [Bacteroidota bacterium]|nr:hypothetical protein [Bacteroidota bacterium]